MALTQQKLGLIKSSKNRNRVMITPAKKTLMESFITIMTKKTIMPIYTLNFQRQKTGLSLGNLFINNYG